MNKGGIFNSLDVGCGLNYQGEINVDLYPDEYFFRRNLRKIPNFIIADCHKLPFKNNSFSIVYCSHLLEHVGVDVTRTAKELLRVAKEKIVIRVPSQVAATAKHKTHNKIFTPRAFDIIFSNFQHKIIMQRFLLRQMRFPLRIITRILRVREKYGIKNPLYNCPSFIPTEIKVEVEKPRASQHPSERVFSAVLAQHVHEVPCSRRTRFKRNLPSSIS